MKKKTKDTILNSILIKLNDSYYHSISHTYNYYNACKNGSDCCDNDYCRCGKIIDFEIVDINLRSLINQFVSLSDNKIDKYCIDRLLNCSAIKDYDSWEPNIDGGYYGESFNGCKLKSKVVDDIKNDMTKLFTLNDVDKIKFSLSKEYGYLLPILENCTKINITNVDINKVIKSNLNHIKKLNSKHVDQYKDYKLPIAICKEEHLGFNLIDGYHRLMANQQTKNVDIIVLS